MKTYAIALPLLCLTLLTACGGGGGGGGDGINLGPCKIYYDEMIATAGEPTGNPGLYELNGDTGIFYEYPQFGFTVALYHGPSFDGCQYDFIED